MDLVPDVCDLIMTRLLNEDVIAACLLACTCKQERERYSRLADEKLTFREIYLEACSGEEGYYFKGQWVLRGEEGFDYAKKEDIKNFRKMSRAETLPWNRRGKKYERRDQKFTKQQWKRGNYDVQ
jgi:hypothetical protein